MDSLSIALKLSRQSDNMAHPPSVCASIVSILAMGMLCISSPM